MSQKSNVPLTINIEGNVILHRDNRIFFYLLSWVLQALDYNSMHAGEEVRAIPTHVAKA
jgi:hypothetical protein